MLAIPVTTRTDGNENTDGMAANTVIFQATVDAAVTMTEHIKTTSDNWLTVQSCSQYPLDQVVKMLRKEHGTGIDVLCSTMFNYSSKCYMKEEVRVLSKHAKMPLSIDVIDGMNCCDLFVEWAPELINDSILESLADSLMKLYCTAFSNADRPIHCIDLLPIHEISLIRSFQSSGQVLPPVTTVIDIFEEHVRSHPDKVAVICKHNSLTYAQLNSIASNLAHELLSKVGEDELKKKAVIILMNKNEYAIASILGVWKTGGHFLPISTSNRSSLSNILECMSPAAIIHNTPEDSIPALQLTANFLILSIHDVPQVHSLKSPQVGRGADETAYVIRTSGSTGKPKQCRISQRSLSVMSNAWKIVYKMDEFAVSVLQWAPLSFDVFVGDLVRALVAAPGKLVMCPDERRLDVKHILHLISTNRISMSEVTPQFGLQLALSARKEDLESLCLFILGSDVLQSHVYQKIRGLLRTDQRLVNSYGMTEATIDSSFYEGDMLPPTRSGAVPIGRPLPGVTFHILDSKTLQVCPVGTIGELYISGDILAGGDAEIVQLKHTKEKALKTGDAACWLPCGNVDLLGRLDNMVKLRGYRISTAEIENKIAQHVKGVKDACVTVNGHSKKAEFLCAFVVRGEDADADIDRKSVQNQLRNHLPYYMLPDFVTVVEEIPLTANGKVGYTSLPSLSQLQKSHEKTSSNSLVASPTISTLKTLFASSLGLPNSLHVDCDRAFMEQGANSLTLVQFATMIATETTFNVGIADIFSYPSICALADFVDTKNSTPINDDFCTALRDASGDSLLGDDIAITGLGLRLPGGIMSLPQLWGVLQRGSDLIADFPETRAGDVKKCLHSKHALASAEVFQGAFLESIKNFDHQFFKIAPGEAKFMSPEQRLFLQVATEALLEGKGLANSKGANIGVFVGLSEIGYSQLEHPDEAISIAGLMPGMVATRVAYQWDLKGPTMLVDTACSSSLMALKMACDSIKRKECKGALVGGVSLVLYPSRTGVFGNTSILSPHFQCKPFDEQADGTAVGEGVMCVYLEPLAEAVDKNKHIYGVIKATACNSVGHGNGITAPSAISQREVIENALATANVKKSEISYIECHGTGTKLGDEIELSALASVFSGLQVGKLPIGSAKSIFGHLDAAAGMLGVFKILASVQFEKITPTANFKNPHAKLANSSLTVLRSTKRWEPDGMQPRIAGVSAFGLTGTNCHAVISESTRMQEDTEDSIAPHLLFSGTSLSVIKQQISSYSSYIKFAVLEGTIPLSHLCHTVAMRLEEVHALTAEQNAFRMVILAETPESTMSLFDILASCSNLKDVVKLSSVRNDVHVFSQEFQESLQKHPLPFHIFLTTGAVGSLFPSSFQQAPGVVVPMYQEFPHWLDPIPQCHNAVPEKILPSLFRDMLTDTRELVRTLNFKPSEELSELQNQFCSSIILQYFMKTGLSQYVRNGKTVSFDDAFLLSKMLEKYEKLFFVMIRELYSNNLLVATGTKKSVYCLDSFKFKCQQILKSTPQAISEVAVKQYPQWADCFRFPLYCSRTLPEVLQGSLNPLSVIYPKGDLDFMYQFDKLGDPLGDVYYNMYMQLIASYAKELSNQQNSGSWCWRRLCNTTASSKAAEPLQC